MRDLEVFSFICSAVSPLLPPPAHLFSFTLSKHLLGVYSMPGCAAAAEPLVLLSREERGSEKDGSRALTVNSVCTLQQSEDIGHVKVGRKRKTTRMGLDQIRVSVRFSSVTQSCPTLRAHGLQHARPPCPSPTPGVYSNPCTSSR